MKATLMRAGVVAGILALVGPAIALADDPGGPEKAAPRSGKAAKGKAYGHGENWDAFAKKFDGNSDGKISKEEFLAKRPAFDRIDGNHDGAINADEVKAMPAVQKRGGSGKNFVARFDTDKDGKVTTAEYDVKRTALFEKIDKNKDGVIEKSEFKMPAGEDDE